MPKNNSGERTGREILYVTQHLGDQQADVMEFTAEERGVYWSLQMAYFQRAQPLSAELSEVYRLAGALTTRERKATKLVLEKKFIQNPDGTWSHEACDAEIERIRAKKRQTSEAANKRWEERSMQTDMRSHMQTDMLTSKPLNQNPEILNKSALPCAESDKKHGDIPAANRPNAADITASSTSSLLNSENSYSLLNNPSPEEAAEAAREELARLERVSAMRSDPNWGIAPSESERALTTLRGKASRGQLFEHLHNQP